MPPTRLVSRSADLLRKLRGGGPVPSPPAASQSSASLADVLACYRLLLGREPDPGGLAHYTQRVQAGVAAKDLVEEFLGSVEFTRAHSGLLRGEGAAREVVTTVEGFRIHVDPSDYAVGHTISRTGNYAGEVSAALRERLAPGATFVDIGANIGWFSLLAASVVGPAGRVIAIEPNPINVALLQHSAKDNSFDNIEVLPVAIADRPGAVALETDGSNGRVIPIDGPPPVAVRASFVVAAGRLDDLLASAGADRVDVVKIDVEGAEPLVLSGGAVTFSHSRPVLITEFFPRALDSSPWGSAQGYLATLRGLGYRLSVIGHSAGPVGGDLDDESIMVLAGGAGRDQVDLLASPA